MKQFIGFLIACVFFVFPASAFAAFSDIRSGSQLESYIEVLVGKGIISGYPDGTFQPERTINRAEALKIIFETIEGQLESSTNSGFPDVPQHEWFAKYVTTAKNKNIIQGYPDGRYRPTQEVNRAEFIKMAMSALPFFSTTPQDKAAAIEQYSDVYDLWYTPYVSAGLQLGFLSKTDQLRPTAPMQRQDAVEIVYHMAQYLEDHPASIAESDIPYVPEESFTVIDPTRRTKGWDELPKSQVNIVRLPNRFEVYSALNGFNIFIDDNNETRGVAVQSQPQELKLENTLNDCVVYFSAAEYRQNETPEEARQRILEEEKIADMYPKTIHVNRFEKVNKYNYSEAYKHIVDQTVQAPNGPEELHSERSYFFGPEKYYWHYILNEDKSKCEPFLETILMGFSLRE